MGRPIKTGLDYFPLDTSWDIKMKLLKAKFHLLGIGCMTELFKDIYHEGYALKWDDDTRLLFANDNSIDIKELEEIVKFAFSKGIFSQDIFDKTGFLTSHGIQARWKKACVDSKRNNIEIERSLDLLSKTPEETPKKDQHGEFPTEETTFTPEETEKTPVESTQMKSEKRKEMNGSGNSFTPEETPLITTIDFFTLQEEIKKVTGFSIDEEIYKRFTSLNLSPEESTGAHNFYAYAKEVVETNYPGKNQTEQRKLFISAVTGWDNLRSEYPAWKNARAKKLSAKAAQTAKSQRPTKCECGGDIREITGKLVCSKCAAEYEFKSEEKRYVKIDYIPEVHFDINSIRTKSGEKKPETVTESVSDNENIPQIF